MTQNTHLYFRKRNNPWTIQVMVFMFLALKSGCFYQLCKHSWGSCLWGQHRVVWNDTLIALSTWIGHAVVTLPNSSVLQSHIHVQCIYVHTMSILPNFNCLQVRCLPRGYKMPQVDWITLWRCWALCPIWTTTWYSTKPCSCSWGAGPDDF